MFSDLKTQQAAVQNVAGLAKSNKPWEEIVRASGLKPVTSDFFSWDRSLPHIPDQERFKEAALVMERGAVSPIIQGEKASYLLRVIDRKDPDAAEFEREKAQFSRGLLQRKREQVFADWIRQVRARAKVKIERPTCKRGLLLERRGSAATEAILSFLPGSLRDCFGSASQRHYV